MQSHGYVYMSSYFGNKVTITSIADASGQARRLLAASIDVRPSLFIYSYTYIVIFIYSCTYILTLTYFYTYTVI